MSLQEINMELYKKSNYHNLIEMARIGEFDCNGLFLINVYSKEGNIPHFHIINNQTHEETCVRIDCAEYFKHNSKQMELTSKQKKELYNFLTSISPYEEDDNKMYYYLIWEEWNRNNRKNRIPKPTKIPNYKDLM